MKLSIIIVSWNVCELTLKCIKSVFRYLKNIDFEVFVVDNNSKDNTVKELENFKKNNNLNNLILIKNKNNLGFAKANNQAIKQATGDYILLLNPDAELIDNNIIKLINFIQSGEKIGVIGPKLLNTNKTLQRSCRRFPKLLDQFFIQLKFYNFFPDKIKGIRKYFMLDFNHDEVKEVDQIMGAAMLIKKQVLDEVGLFDEKFWSTFEEVDLCKRIKDKGWKIHFNPECNIIHHKEQSFKQMASLRKQINFNHSLYRYFKKHKPFYQLFILWFLQPINILLTWFGSRIGVRKIIGKRKDF
ncbi:MAG: glycosyltransferase family 2 protein [Patescibacteria group bacterium]